MSKIVAIKTEVYSRIVGYYRPVQSWNPGKKEEFKDRHTYSVNEMAPLSEEEPHSESKAG